jgi:hypothetical protein
MEGRPFPFPGRGWEGKPVLRSDSTPSFFLSEPEREMNQEYNPDGIPGQILDIYNHR